jgi:NAD(P)-dependent dehydrogenase (short-subunit alcohol dehydrogenase family)
VCFRGRDHGAMVSSLSYLRLARAKLTFRLRLDRLQAYQINTGQSCCRRLGLPPSLHRSSVFCSCSRFPPASYYFTSFALLPLLTKAKTLGNYPEAGSIINISSISGITKTSQRGQFSYNVRRGSYVVDSF